MIQIICQKVCLTVLFAKAAYRAVKDQSQIVFFLLFVHKYIYCYALNKNDLYLTRVGLICRGTGRTWYFQDNYICFWLCIILYFALSPSNNISLHFLVILQDHCFFLLSLFSALSPFPTQTPQKPTFSSSWWASFGGGRGGRLTMLSGTLLVLGVMMMMGRRWVQLWRRHQWWWQ